MNKMAAGDAIANAVESDDCGLIMVVIRDDGDVDFVFNEYVTVGSLAQENVSRATAAIALVIKAAVAEMMGVTVDESTPNRSERRKRRFKH